MRDFKKIQKNFRGEKMRKFGLSLIVALTMVMVISTAAFAVHTQQSSGGTYYSPELGYAGNKTITAEGAANKVHAVVDNTVNGTLTAGLDCAYCHENQTKHTSGPHGGYTTTSNKCMTCHGLHARSNNNKAWSARLLPGETTVQVCNFCHDLTQSDLGPYYGGYMSGKTYSNNNKPKVVKSAHRVTGVNVYDATNSFAAGFEKYDGAFNKNDLVVPGGDQATGGNRDLVTGGQGALSGSAFTCDSCHTPHAITGSTVDPYLGESHIKFSALTGSATFYATNTGNGGATTTVLSSEGYRFWMTDRLLKARIEDPNKVRNTTTRVYTKYNSDWCASCHMGRFANDPVNGEATVHNHPVSIGNNNPKAAGYKFDQLAGFINGYDANSLVAEAKSTVRLSSGDWVYPTFYAVTNPAKQATAKYGRANGWNGSYVFYGTPFGGDPRTNKQYAMTAGDPLNANAARPDGYINIADAAGGPSCQQCHGSARDIEESFAQFADEVHHDELAMNFPHVSENKALLVEEGDDFCTNCHGLDNLP